MKIKSILAVAAIAMATTIGTATADELASVVGSAEAGPALTQHGQFTFISGVPATPMGVDELSTIRGGFTIESPGRWVTAGPVWQRGFGGATIAVGGPGGPVCN